MRLPRGRQRSRHDHARGPVRRWWLLASVGAVPRVLPGTVRARWPPRARGRVPGPQGLAGREGADQPSGRPGGRWPVARLRDYRECRSPPGRTFADPADLTAPWLGRWTVRALPHRADRSDRRSGSSTVDGDVEMVHAGGGQEERVTGIEPAWPAWKAWGSRRHPGWSEPSQAKAVPSAPHRSVSVSRGRLSRSARGHPSAAVRAALDERRGRRGAGLPRRCRRVVRPLRQPTRRCPALTGDRTDWSHRAP